MSEYQSQPNLISLELPETEALLELFPGVWQAVENLASGMVETRHKALETLLQSGAPRVSPLVAYVLSTRLFDPDIEFRKRIVEALANLMRRDADGKYAADAVRSQVITALSYFDDRGLFSMLEVGLDQKDMMPHIEKLIKYSPRTGKFLKEMARDRTYPLGIREVAIRLIGRLGIVDALSELERVRNRIEMRQEGQRSMPFAPPSSTNEMNLLPEIQKAILALEVG